MPQMKIKGQEYIINPAKDSFNRRAVQYTNAIIEQFRRIGISSDDIAISEERNAMKRTPAKVSWWIEGQHCNYSCQKMGKFVDNLLVVQKVIERHTAMVLAQETSVEEFIEAFKEHKDVSEHRDQAREFFSLEKDHSDLDVINKKYKTLAKTLHPDMPTGDHERFKELNEHHKTLRRELE